jgi:hypothetical protein
MPNDAKLGLVLGVGLVVAIAVIFCRREPANSASPAAPAAVVAPAANTPPLTPAGNLHLVPADPTSVKKS